MAFSDAVRMLSGGALAGGQVERFERAARKRYDGMKLLFEMQGRLLEAEVKGIDWGRWDRLARRLAEGDDVTAETWGLYEECRI